MAITAPLNRVYEIAVQPNFVQRIAAAALDQVATVVAEPGATTDHANRMSFAAQVAYNPLQWASKMSLGIVVTNANIQAALTSGNPDVNNTAVADADIKAGIVTVWNFFADSVATLQADKVL